MGGEEGGGEGGGCGCGEVFLEDAVGHCEAPDWELGEGGAEEDEGSFAVLGGVLLDG